MIFSAPVKKRQHPLSWRKMIMVNSPALMQTFARKYRIVPAICPWVSEDVVRWKLRIKLFHKLQQIFSRKRSLFYRSQRNVLQTVVSLLVILHGKKSKKLLNYRCVLLNTKSVMIFLLETHLPRSSLIHEVAHFSGSPRVTVMQSFITALRVTYSMKRKVDLNIRTFSSSHEHAIRIGHVANKNHFQQMLNTLFFLFLFFFPFFLFSGFFFFCRRSFSVCRKLLIQFTEGQSLSQFSLVSPPYKRGLATSLGSDHLCSLF